MSSVSCQSAKVALASAARFTSCLELQGVFLADQVVTSAVPALIKVFSLPLECPFEFGRETV